MDERLFNMILLCIPAAGAVITGFIIPYMKAKISAVRMDEIIKGTRNTVKPLRYEKGTLEEI